VAAWAAEWRGLRGAEMRGVLGQVAAMGGQGVEAVRGKAKAERLQQLMRPVGDGEGEGEDSTSSSSDGSGSDSSSSSSDSDSDSSSSSSSSRSEDGTVGLQVPQGYEFTEAAHQLTYPGLLELGVTGTEAAAAAAAAAAAISSHQGPITTAAPHCNVPRSNPPAGIAQATTRLAFFQRMAKRGLGSKGGSKTPAPFHSLVQLLTAPHAELVQQYPKLDPGFVAARVQGLRDAEGEVLQMLYPHLGVQALSVEQLEGLKPRHR
jgi:hypothetical protein